MGKFRSKKTRTNQPFDAFPKPNHSVSVITLSFFLSVFLNLCHCFPAPSPVYSYITPFYTSSFSKIDDLPTPLVRNMRKHGIIPPNSSSYSRIQMTTTASRRKGDRKMTNGNLFYINLNLQNLHRNRNSHTRINQRAFLQSQQRQTSRLYALQNNNNNNNNSPGSGPGSDFDFSQLLSFATKSFSTFSRNIGGYLPTIFLVLLLTGNLGFILNLILFSIAVPILGLVGTYFFLSSKIHVGPCPVCGADNLGNNKNGSQIQCNSCSSIIETNTNPTTRKKEFVLSDIDYNNNNMNMGGFTNRGTGIGGAGNDPFESLLSSLFGDTAGGIKDGNGNGRGNDKGDGDGTRTSKYKGKNNFRKDDDVIDVVAKNADEDD